MDDGEELVEITEAELASLRLQKMELPTHRGWGSPTFACHRHIASCVLSCVCPCVQFGMNQRAAFGASCFKWTLLWLLPLAALYVVVDQWVAPVETAAEGAVQHVLAEPSEVDRSTAFLFAVPVAMALLGLVGALRRRALRDKYGIGGTTLGDFCCHCLCTCCSLAKEVRALLDGPKAPRRHENVCHRERAHASFDARTAVEGDPDPAPRGGDCGRRARYSRVAVSAMTLAPMRGVTTRDTPCACGDEFSPIGADKSNNRELVVRFSV
jgi:Cys-rich protein (TIGR01571 family)